jgi:hypothetical protein
VAGKILKELLRSTDMPIFILCEKPVICLYIQNSGKITLNLLSSLSDLFAFYKRF